MRRDSNNVDRSNNNSVYKGRERERKRLGTQVLILPIMERSFYVNQRERERS